MTSPFADFDDPTTADGRKLWELATKPLKSLFDGNKSGYPLFKAQLRNKIKQCYWEDITTFSVNGQDLNLIDNADLIPMATITLKRRARDQIILMGPGGAVAQPFLQQATKQHLQSRMLHTVLTESVTGDLEQHVAELQNKDKTHGDGATLLKLIQDKARGKAVRQQMKNVREEIKSLSIKEHKWNITKFNDRLETLLNTLRNNEEEFLAKDITDVVVNNYKLVKHEEFASMVTMELNTAEKANQDVDYEELMALGDAKYQSLVKQKIWGRKTTQEEQILALQTQLHALQAKQTPPSTPSQPNPPRTPGGPRTGRTGKGPHYQDWHLKNPDNKKTMKKVVKFKGKEEEVTYYWCPNHNQGKGMWTRHTPEECNNKDKPPNRQPRLVATPVILDQDLQE